MLLPTMLPVRWPLDSYGPNETPTAHDYSVWVGIRDEEYEEGFHECEGDALVCHNKPIVYNIGDDGQTLYCYAHCAFFFKASPSWPAEDYDPDSWDVGYYLSLTF